MKNSVGKGAFLLILSGIICKIFGAFFRLPLTNILGIEGIGVFQMVMSIYSLSLVLVTGGVTNSLSKLVSSARAKGEYGKINGYFRIALLFSAGVSLVLGLCYAFFSNQISSLQGAQEATFSYMLLAFLLPLGALIGVYRGIIQGYENMTPTAISQIIEQSVKLCFGLLFAKILASNGLASGVFGAFLGLTVSEFLAFSYLGVVILVKYKTKAISAPVGRDFFRAVLPLSAGGAVVPFTHALDSLFIVSLLTKAGFESSQATMLYGLHSGVVGALLNFPLIISLSVGTSLLPKVSYLSSQQDVQGQKSVISKSFSILWSFLLPLVFGIASVAEVLYPIIYPNFINGYLDYAVKLTYIGGVSIVLTALMQFLLALLQAKGCYLFSMFASIFGSLIKILLVFTLTVQSNVNIFALPLSNIFLAGSVCLFALVKLGSLIRISFFNFALPLLSSTIMFLVVKLILDLFGNIWGLVFAICAGGVIYLLLMLPLLMQLLKPLFNRKSKIEN